MKYLVKPVLLLSAVGLLLSVLAHITALLGIDLHSAYAAFVLQVGIYPVWLSSMLLGENMRCGRPFFRWGFGRRLSWKQVCSGCPVWMRYAWYGLLGYAVLSFMLYARDLKAGADDTSPSLAYVRGFSGHWMVFYYAAFAIAYSAFKRPELLRPTLCDLGHDNWPGDEFCSECGQRIAVKARK